MARAYLSGQHTMASMAEHFGVHDSDREQDGQAL